jgi:hypothetical protein
MSTLSVCKVQSVDLPSGRVVASCSLGHVTDETVDGIRALWKRRFIGWPAKTPSAWPGMEVPCPVCEAIEAMLPAPAWPHALPTSGTFKATSLTPVPAGSGLLWSPEGLPAFPHAASGTVPQGLWNLYGPNRCP